jgi:hypothetical protein
VRYGLPHVVAVGPAGTCHFHPFRVRPAGAHESLIWTTDPAERPSGQEKWACAGTCAALLGDLLAPIRRLVEPRRGLELDAQRVGVPVHLQVILTVTPDGTTPSQPHYLFRGK